MANAVMMHVGIKSVGFNGVLWEVCGVWLIE